MDKVIIENHFDKVSKTYSKRVQIKNPNKELMDYQTAYNFSKKLEQNGYEVLNVIGTNRYSKYSTLKSLNGEFNTIEDYLQGKPQEIVDKLDGYYMFNFLYRKKPNNKK
jgi:hypothetical protein